MGRAGGGPYVGAGGEDKDDRDWARGIGIGMGLEGLGWGRREPQQLNRKDHRDGAGPRARDGAGLAKSQPHPNSSLLGRSPRAALRSSERSLPESPQEPSDAPFQRREQRGRPSSARSPRSPAPGQRRQSA